MPTPTTTTATARLPSIVALINRRSHGFCRPGDVDAIAKEHPAYLLLIRCGGFRCLVPAAQVESAVKAIESGDDYVRDVSIPATR